MDADEALEALLGDQRTGDMRIDLIEGLKEAMRPMPLSLAGDFEEVDLGWSVVELAVVGGAFEAVVVGSVSFDGTVALSDRLTRPGPLARSETTQRARMSGCYGSQGA